MILINDRGVGTINPNIVYERIKTRCIKLREIMDDENATQQRQDWAYDEYIGYQKELQNLNEMQKIPFDVLVVVQQENESHIDCSDIDMTRRAPIILQ